MKSSYRYYRWLCLVSLGLASGCGLSNQQLDNTSNNLNPWVQIQANLEEVSANLRMEDSKTTIKGVLQKETSLYTSGQLTYPIANYGTQRTLLFGQYQDGVYQTGDTITLPASDQTVPLVAVAPGRILQISSSNNLGRFLILEFVGVNSTYHMVYSQLDNTTVTVQVGDTVTAGQTIATVTVTEPRNLHFALYPFTGIELFTGQVSTLPELQLWLNPFDFFRQPETS